MIKYLQLPYHFDAAKMQLEIQRLEKGLWQQHYQKLHYTGEWSAIPLRSTGGKADNIIIAPTNEIPYGDTMFLLQCPYIRSVLSEFDCPLHAVRLLKLSAGAVIKEHRDAELNYENGEIRLHIPVVTHDDVEFYLDTERIYLKEGECWYMNFNLLHNISNKSKVDRVHLVIDTAVNDWVKGLFSSPAIKIRKEIPDETLYDTNTQLEMIAHLRQMNTKTSNALADEMEKQVMAKKTG